MTIQYDPLLSDEQYREYRYSIILGLEQNGKEELNPYSDNPTKGGYATIGSGFRIDVNLDAILDTLGFETDITKASAEQTSTTENHHSLL